MLGLAWLAVLAGMAWLRLPEPGTPRVGILPVPTLMLLGGLALGLVLSALARPLARIGARRRRKVIARRLRDSVGVVARELIVAPVQAVLDRHRTPASGWTPPPPAAPDRLPAAPDRRGGPAVHSRRGLVARSTAQGRALAAAASRADSGNTRRCGGHRAETDEVMGMNETYMTISGNVVGDPQVRRTRADVPFVTFRVASNVRRVDHKTGEYIDAGTNFVNVTAFRSLGAQPGQLAGEGAPGRRLRPDAHQPVDQRRADRHDRRDRRLQRRPRPHPWAVHVPPGGATPARAARPAGRPGRAAGDEALDGSGDGHETEDHGSGDDRRP